MDPRFPPLAAQAAIRPPPPEPGWVSGLPWQEWLMALPLLMLLAWT
jgi:hypothetical protein